MTDKNITKVKMMYTNMDGSQVEERYEFTIPTICVGNIIVGEKYIEPIG